MNNFCDREDGVLWREKQCKPTQGSAVSMECRGQRAVVWETGKFTGVEEVCSWRSDGEDAHFIGYGIQGKEFRLRNGDQLEIVE